MSSFNYNGEYLPRGGVEGDRAGLQGRHLEGFGQAASAGAVDLIGERDPFRGLDASLGEAGVLRLAAPRWPLRLERPGTAGEGDGDDKAE